MTPSETKQWFEENLKVKEWGVSGNPEQGLALCPLHDDRNPSLSINAEKGVWHCLSGCGSGGINDLCRRLNLQSPFKHSNSSSQDRKDDGIETIHKYTDESWNNLFAFVRFKKGVSKRQKGFFARWENGQFLKGLNNTRRVLYNLSSVINTISKGGQIYIVEGEKCADILIKNGICATTNPMGASNWQPEYTEVFKEGTEVIIIPDSDVPGEKHKKVVTSHLLKKKCKIKHIYLGYDITDSNGKDVYDWLQTYTIKELEELVKNTDYYKPEQSGTLSKIITGEQLEFNVYVPAKVIIPGLITEGLTVFAGKSKIGKSYFMMQVMLAVTSGGMFFGQKIEKGRGLYISYEDKEWRLQERARSLMGEGEHFPPLSMWVEDWTKGMEGLSDLREFLTVYDNVRMVIIDPFVRFRIKAQKNVNVYDEDYEAMSHIKKLADEFHVSIVVNHHFNKGKAQDSDSVFDRILGSTGMIGSADTLIAIERQIGKAEAKISIQSKNLREDDSKPLMIRRPEGCCGWELIGNYDESQDKNIRDRIMNIFKELRGDDSITAKGIAYDLKYDIHNISNILNRMKSDKLIEMPERGYYRLNKEEK